ncbi:hypothetical protein ACLOJK_022732 [Asimina triloba]
MPRALLAFHILPARVTPHSWKVIQAMTWFCEREGYRANRCLWRDLLVCRLLQSYAVFFGSSNVKAIDNPPNPTPGWKLSLFFRQVIFEEGHPGRPRTVGGASTQSYFKIRCGVGRLSAVGSNEEFLCWCESSSWLVTTTLVPSLSKVEREEERSQKRARLSAKGNSSVDPDSFAEGVSQLSPVRGTSPMTDHKDERSAVLLHELFARSELRGTRLLSECEAVLSEVAQLWEELEVSRAKVAHLQALLQGSLVVAEYLRSDIYHCKEEFERVHYSQGGYVRALSDVRRSFGGDLARASPAVDLKE